MPKRHRSVMWSFVTWNMKVRIRFTNGTSGVNNWCWKGTCRKVENSMSFCLEASECFPGNSRLHGKPVGRLRKGILQTAPRGPACVHPPRAAARVPRRRHKIIVLAISHLFPNTLFQSYSHVTKLDNLNSVTFSHNMLKTLMAKKQKGIKHEWLYMGMDNL